MEVEDALLVKEREKRSFVGPDDVLDEISAKNAFIVFIFLSMSFVWCIAAPHTMISAFINESDDSHCSTNSSCVRTVSITSEFGLYGDKSSHAASSVSASIIGDIFGGFILSALSDRYGRKPAVCAALLMSGTFGVLSALAPNIYVFIALRFFQGSFFTGMTIVNWVLSYESIPHSVRSYSSMLFGAMWVAGYCILSPLAYYIHNWRWLTAATCIPTVITGIVYIIIIPESFHFLVSKRKDTKIRKWMDVAEKFANRKLEITADHLLQDMAITHPTHEGGLPVKTKTMTDGFREILNNRALLIDITVMAYLWICNGFVYYALSLFSTSLAGNRHVNFVLLGLAELPAYIISPYLLDRFGRRKVVSIGHAITGFSMLAALFLPSDSIYGALLLWVIAKCSISSSFNNIFIYASEVFPTTYRNFCIGICSVIAKFITIFAPHLGALKAIDPRLPTLFYGVLGITSALATLILPETLNKPLPSTVSDVQAQH